MKTLLLKLSGPLQSWGTRSHFETRRTDLYPSKSAVLGLVAAALGYRREQDEEICALNALHFAVRVDQPGILRRDYQTAHTYTKDFAFERTYVTQRYYLQDAVFVVALGHENEEWMEEIQNALLCPYFSLSMGRRSAPVPADFALGIFSSGVMEKLSIFPWQAASWYKKKNIPRLTVYGDAQLIDKGIEILRRDAVVSFSQKSRQFQHRLEREISIILPNENLMPEHDAFRAVGGQSVSFQSRN